MRRLGKPELPPPATETARNSRIRIARRDAWWRAERLVDYWRARLDWSHALSTAQRYGIADSASFPPAENETRLDLVGKWREAVAKKLLTPAPDLAAITWKRAQLKSRGFHYVPVKKERVERAIAADVEFLAAHPTRRRYDQWARGFGPAPKTREWNKSYSSELWVKKIGRVSWIG